MKNLTSFSFLFISLLAFSLNGTCSDSTTIIKSTNAVYLAVGGKGNNRSVNF